jgi:hypothetical protein
VKRLPDRNGLPARIEVKNSGEIPMATVEMVPFQKLAGRIAEPNLRFGGTWTFKITPAADGAVLRIAERGWFRIPGFVFSRVRVRLHRDHRKLSEITGEENRGIASHRGVTHGKRSGMQGGVWREEE